MVAIASPELVPGAAAPLIGAAGYMLYRVRTRGPLICLRLASVPDRDHRPLGVADLEPGDVLDRVAELRVGLDDHLPGPAEPVEVVDVERPR